MKKFYILLVLIFITGCSTREYYEPKTIDKSIDVSKNLPSKIGFFTKDVATLKTAEVIPLHKKLPKDFEALNNELAKKANTLLVDNKKIKFDNLIVTAIKQNNLVVVLFANNSVKIYDLNKNKTIFSYKFDKYLGLRKFVAAPVFYKDLLIVPTLDGKLAVFSDNNGFKLVRTIIVSDKNYFSNIIFLAVKSNTLIAASRDKIISITPGVVSTKNYNIKHILVDNYNLYLFTTEGDIKKLNLQLREVKSLSLPFANIISPIFVGKYIYFIEYGDGTYLMRVDRNLEHLKVFKLNAPNIEDNSVFAKNGILYIGDKYIDLKSIK